MLNICKNVFGFDEEKIAETIATELAASEAKSKESNADGQKFLLKMQPQLASNFIHLLMLILVMP